jgi:hypothetical protein
MVNRIARKTSWVPGRWEAPAQPSLHVHWMRCCYWAWEDIQGPKYRTRRYVVRGDMSDPVPFPVTPPPASSPDSETLSLSLSWSPLSTANNMNNQPIVYPTLMSLVHIILVSSSSSISWVDITAHPECSFCPFLPQTWTSFCCAAQPTKHHHNTTQHSTVLSPLFSRLMRLEVEGGSTHQTTRARLTTRPYWCTQPHCTRTWRAGE